MPILASGLVLLLTLNFVLYLNPCTCNILNNFNLLILQAALIALTFTSFAWFGSVIYESGKGFHTLPVQRGLRAGFWLFLVSEAMLFFSFFWAYFHLSVNPSVSINHEWPSTLGIQHIDPFGIPLLNTVLLLSSGWSATLAHRCILATDFVYSRKKQIEFFVYLGQAILLGYIFLTCQYIEYSLGLQQSWSSNVYWSIFFLLTGFHGVHVIIGTLFLQFNYIREGFCLHNKEIIMFIVNKIEMFYRTYYKIHSFVYEKLTRANPQDQIRAKRRLLRGIIRMRLNANAVALSAENKSALALSQIERYAYNPAQHLGLESAFYYWHFVDAIWILLFIIVYYWGV